MTSSSSERDRWASLPSSGHELTPEQRVIVHRMVDNAGRARERLVERWQAERDAKRDAT